MSESKAKPREERRNLNPQESESMGFVDLMGRSNEDGWPYDDAEDDGRTCIYDSRGGIWGWEAAP